MNFEFPLPFFPPLFLFTPKFFPPRRCPGGKLEHLPIITGNEGLRHEYQRCISSKWSLKNLFAIFLVVGIGEAVGGGGEDALGFLGHGDVG